MEQREEHNFPVDDALEMVIMFDSVGKISYANETAKKKLEYKRDLCGRHISDIFPNTFRVSGKGFETDYPFGNGQHNLVAYRKNRTCFPVETRIETEKDNPDKYVWRMIFWKKNI